MKDNLLIALLAFCLIVVVVSIFQSRGQENSAGSNWVNRAMRFAVIAFCLPNVGYFLYVWWIWDDQASRSAVGFAYWLLVFPGTLVLALVAFLLGLIDDKPSEQVDG